MDLANARRSGRIPKEIPVLLIGSDTHGRVFAEQTETVMLSRHGAGVVSRYQLVPEQEMIIRLVETNKEAEMRVVGRIASQSRGDAYGMTFVEADGNFWGVDFPPSADSDKEAGSSLLECSSCKNRRTIHRAEIEWEVFDLNAQITHYCDHCGMATIWRRPAGRSEGLPVSPQPTQPARPKQEPAPPLSSAPGVGPGNRRKRVRARVNLAACIRYAGLDDESAICEDMSRGGLRFTSRKRYFEKSVIQIAAPYAPGVPGIFVHAEIVYVLALPEQKLFRCGAEYVRLS